MMFASLFSFSLFGGVQGQHISNLVLWGAAGRRRATALVAAWAAAGTLGMETAQIVFDAVSAAQEWDALDEM